ncbi:MAG: hypothetical protein JST65_06400 [Acidobacteria bacterium]|nr:hypothetical protein [Acidobacteriota bacterium]
MASAHNPLPARPTSQAPLHVPGFTPISGLPEKSDLETLSKAAILFGDQKDFVDIPPKLVKLIEQCWKTASVTNPRERGPVQVGTARVQPKSWKPEDILAKKKMEESNAYAKVVAPTFRKPMGLMADEKVTPVGIANDWRLMKPLERLSAFTFRGDSRGPNEIASADGFFPPVTRTDEAYVDSVIFPQFESYMERRFQTKITRAEFNTAFRQYSNSDRAGAPVVKAYFIWRALVEHEAFHIPRMVVNEALKGYISTSRAMSVAYEFSLRKNGWVYLTRVRGGFLIPTAIEADWVGNYERECELAYPGHLPWVEIFAFRKTRPPGGGPKKRGDSKFHGPLYVRNGFRETYPEAYQKVVQAFTCAEQ